MNIKNYTSDVPAHITIGRIQALLIEARVNSLTMEYGPTGEITALRFEVHIDRKYMVRMTANVDAVHETFWREYVGDDRVSVDGERVAGCGRSGNKKKVRASFREQALRTAWKIQQDWVEVQLTLIRLQKLEFLQVFMPYLWDGKQTFFETLRSGGFAALPAPRSD